MTGDAYAALDVGEPERARLRFLAAAHGLTAVERLNRVLDGSRAETSAEHSWHLALAALVLAPDLAPDVALERVLGMLLVHDVVEVDAGDVPVYDAAARAAAAAAELAAAERLFGLLPGDDGTRLRELWDEFEAAETDEARFARAVDRLQPILVHWAGGGVVWRERAITATDEERVLAVIEGLWPPLLPLARALVDDAVRRGDLAR